MNEQELRKMIMDNVDDEVAARKLLVEMKLLQDRVTEREWDLENRLMESGV